ncbi:MAG: N-acetyltransferase [Sphingobacteriales bacterium]|nr:MAG: N-acetyltransferase [Sphingobacteriales bacterium]
MLAPNFTPYPTITTERLLLRKIEMSAAKDLFILRSDERMMKYLDRPRAQTIEDVEKLIQIFEKNRIKNEGINWGITWKDNSRLLGNICFWKLNLENERGEIGYLLHADFHRKGIMQEAMIAVLNYGFTELKLHSVEANVNPENTASIKLLEKNNFVSEAYYRENYFYDGKFLNSTIYSLLNK